MSNDADSNRHGEKQPQNSNLPSTTAALLLAQYGGKIIIPLEDVRRDYFPHLTADNFMRKLGSGDIKLPVVRMDASQKCHKGIHFEDLARYLDARREAALKELRQLHR